jgi:uncharacterized protein YjbJ (UPF0337 family)
MNWDQIAGTWKEYAGRARTKWGELTDDDLEQVAGRRDEMVGVIQKRYGYAKERAEDEVDRWVNDL